MRQVVDVTGYKPNGLTALAVWYARNESAATVAHTLTLTALDASDVAIGSATTSGSLTPPDNVWRRYELSKVLPAGTKKVQVDINPTTNAMLNVDGLSLHVGQMSAELLTNPSFTNGTFTGWTNVSNSFVANTTKEYASDSTTLRSAQGGAFASSEIKQEVAIPAGYEYGDAVLTLARSNDFDDNGTVTLEVLDGGGAVLTSATTGAESIASGWERRKLIATLVDGAATLRVRLIAARALGAGNSGALFDDASLRIHKDLDPAFELSLDFTEPHRAAMPRSFEEAYLAWPELAVPAVWDGADVLPSVRAGLFNIAATAAWSDASTPSPAKYRGHWTHDDDADSVDAYRFTRGGACIEVDGYGSFAKADTFSIAVCFRVTEQAMTLAAGLCGNRASTGWGLSLDTSGRVVATLEGTAVRTATGTVDHRDGAAHWVLMTWNGTTLRVVDALGSATNATDPGEFLSAEPMRIGRESAAGPTGSIDIARVLMWDGEVITLSELQDTIDTIGDDPNELVVYTSDKPVWVDAADDADGATLVRCSTRHMPIAAGGLSIGAACENLVVSTNYPAEVSCGPETNATATQSIVDPTGLARGVRVANSVNGAGYRLEDLDLPDNAAVRVVFWARTVDGVARNLTVMLVSSSDVPEDSDVIVLSGLWQRFEKLLGWGQPTATGHLRFSIDDASPCTFDLGGVVYADQPGSAANGSVTAYPDAAVSVADRHGVVTQTLPLQLHREGEIEIECIVTNPVHGSYLASVDNGTSDQKNQRALVIDTALAKGTLWNDSAAPGAVTAAPTWTSLNVLRLRWNRLELPESLGEQQAICIGDAVQDAIANAFTLSTSVESEKVRLGGGNANGSTSPHALLTRVVVRAREEKLE